MQQTLTINITDPAGLPQTGLANSWFSEHFLLIIALVLLLVAAVVVLFASKFLRGGGTAFKSKALYTLPLVILAPLTLLTFAPVSSNSYAAATVSVPNQTINIVQGETSATFTFTADVDSSAYTDGYRLVTNINLAASNRPAGVFLFIPGAAVDATSDRPARDYRKDANPVDSGEIEYTITVPADAPIGDNYASVVLDYNLVDFVKKYLAEIQQERTTAYPGSFSLMTQLNLSTCRNADYDATNNGNNPNNTIILTDARNSQTYRVRKLADNKCWMIDNLALGSYTLTSSDSNVTASFTIGGEVHDGSTRSAVSGAGICVGGTITGSGGYLTCDGSYTQSVANNTFSAFSNPGTTSWCSAAGNLPVGTTTGCGYLYNWYTATAGTGTYGHSTEYTTVSGSICPVGWKLPTGKLSASDTASDFQNLDVVYGGKGVYHFEASVLTNLWQTAGAFSGVHSGRYEGFFDGLSLNGSGNWWSSNVGAAQGAAYNLSVGIAGVVPGVSSSSQHYGYAVRCVL